MKQNAEPGKPAKLKQPAKRATSGGIKISEAANNTMGAYRQLRDTDPINAALKTSRNQINITELSRITDRVNRSLVDAVMGVDGGPTFYSFHDQINSQLRQATQGAFANVDKTVLDAVMEVSGRPFKSLVDQMQEQLKQATQGAFANVDKTVLDSVMGISNPAFKSALGSTGSLSTLLAGVEQNNGVLARTILAAEASAGRIDWATQVASKVNTLDSIKKLARSYELPNVGLMTHLASVRSTLDAPTPMSPYVDRIGQGWASLGDRLLRGKRELAPLMPGSNRLATTAYRLDILAGQDDVELTDHDVAILDTRSDQVDVAAEWLATLSTNLVDRWVGMWDRMHQRGADWKSQAANSAVELMVGLLKTLAPTDTVRQWQLNHDEKYADPELYCTNDRTEPTRRLRLYYLGDVYNVSERTIESLFMDVPDILRTFQSIKHGSHTDAQFQTYVAQIAEVVVILVPNRRR